MRAETVRRWFRAGQLRGIWLSGRAGRWIPASKLERFLREQTGPGLDKPASESYAEVDGRTLTGKKSVPAAGESAGTWPGQVRADPAHQV